jgi:ribosomal protein S27AE
MSRVVDLDITCPRCGTAFSAQGHTLVDSSDEADAEVFYELQQGSINIARCPNCSASGLIPIPVILHHPEGELLLAFVPGAEQMSEEQVNGVVGPMFEGFISAVPPEKQAEYLFEPIVTDDPMALVMAARGENLDENYEESGEGEEFGEFEDDEDELSPEEMQQIQVRQELLQKLLTHGGAMDSLTRIGILRENKDIVDDMLSQLIGIVTDQAQTIQPEAVPVLNKIMNEVEVFRASN